MKKGFTLVECIVAMAIASSILSFQCMVLIKYCNMNVINNVKSIEEGYLTEGAIIIEKLILNDFKEVEIKDNFIFLTCKDNSKKTIRFNSNSKKILVDYYDCGSNFSKDTNIVCSNISDMTVVKKNYVLYISITSIGGQKIDRCIAVKNFY